MLSARECVTVALRGDMAEQRNGFRCLRVHCPVALLWRQQVHSVLLVASPSAFMPVDSVVLLSGQWACLS